MNSSQKAIALTWTKELVSPVVVAKGKNLSAQKILEIAKENGIKIVSDSVLADILDETEIGMNVPQNTFEALAVIFAFLDEAIVKEWL